MAHSKANHSRQKNLTLPCYLDMYCRSLDEQRGNELYSQDYGSFYSLVTSSRALKLSPIKSKVKKMINTEARYFTPFKNKGIINYFILTYFGKYTDMGQIPQIQHFSISPLRVCGEQ